MRGSEGDTLEVTGRGQACFMARQLIQQAHEDVAASERMVLKHPSFGERLTARLEERAQFDRVRPVDDQVELRSPVARHSIGDGFDELVRTEGSARG